MFARKRSDGNYDILNGDGSIVTRLDVAVFPVGSDRGAGYEHVYGIILAAKDVAIAGIEIEYPTGKGENSDL